MGTDLHAFYEEHFINSVRLNLVNGAIIEYQLGGTWIYSYKDSHACNYWPCLIVCLSSSCYVTT